MMGKKKRQRDPNNDSDSSDDDNCELVNGCLCPHITKAVSLTSVKKVLKNLSKLGTCLQCQKKEGASDKDDVKEPNTIWICLQCGHQGCGRYSEDKHALVHYETPRSLCHAIAVCIDSWSVWCYDCDDEVSPEVNKKLLECLDFIKKHHQKDTKLNNKSDVPPDSDRRLENNISLVVNNFKKEDSSSKSETKGHNVRGLNNLGNTCFFNSVMQNISQSNCLLDIMDGYSNSGIGLELDPCCMKMADKQVLLDPLNVTLQEAGAMTKSIGEFLKEMQSTTKTSTVNPSVLFSHICKKAPQFRGFRQQDSHELLRHLLDGLRLEEVKRVKTAILNHFNINGKSSIDNLEEEIKQKIKAYGRSGNQTIVDKVFGGLLISTVVCEECHMSSQVFEPFLDLSLPVSEEKPQRSNVSKKLLDSVVANKKESSPAPSKHQEKKMKKQSKKDAKRKAKQDKITNKIINLTEGNQENLAEEKHENQSDAKSDNPVNNSKKSESLSEISDADVEDNGDTSSNVDGVAPENQKEQSSESDDFIILENDSVTDDIGNLSAKVKGMRIRRKSQSADNLLVENVDNMEESFEVIDSAAATGGPQDDKSETDTKEEWKARSLTSLAPRYHCSSHECSIQSCLNQFTAAELLTGSNKFGCENCTKLKAEKHKSGTEEKTETVYSIANKQLLIFCPPAILTLHLKRFQQVGFNLKKINRHVNFPMMLDLAPFCSSICLGLPTLKKGQKSVLYSLYGIVEHSGRLSGGHYTAYIKVRKHDTHFKNFLNTKASGQYEIDCLVKEMADKCDSAQPSLPPSDIDATASNGKWYHISDSFVRESSPESVLKAQAYLLFYERVV